MRSNSCSVSRLGGGLRRPQGSGHAKAGLVKLDLAVAADLVGDLLPSGGNRIRSLLGRLVLAVHSFYELILCNRIVLEDPRNAGLDGGVRVVIAVEVRTE